jgi:Ca2+-binding EF-hand superfamily protein
LRRKVLPPPDADSLASDNKEAAARFALADLNGDGQLSKHEFESEFQPCDHFI